MWVFSKSSASGKSKGSGSKNELVHFGIPFELPRERHPVNRACSGRPWWPVCHP
jgi:hypothetical protein